MTIGWRSALPRTGLDEASALPLLRLAEKLAFAGERGAATEAYREHLAAFPDDVDALESLAAVLGRMGRAEELDVRRRLAARMSRDLGVAPEHSEAVIAFEMGSRGAGEAPAEAPAAFVTATFDAFAEGFDEELRDRLSYLGPELIAARLERAFGPARAALAICDVGCGTGLLGALLAPHARSLAGVDLSPRMLDKARARGVYGELSEADLTVFLAGRPEAFDVVTAADVFVYVGDLGPALAAIAAALRPGGGLFFSVERATGESHELHRSGRYAHSEAHVRGAAAAAGLREISVEEEVLRRERGQPVRALLCAFRR